LCLSGRERTPLERGKKRKRGGDEREAVASREGVKRRETRSHFLKKKRERGGDSRHAAVHLGGGKGGKGGEEGDFPFRSEKCSHDAGASTELGKKAVPIYFGIGGREKEGGKKGGRLLLHTPARRVERKKKEERPTI